jgi:hypothetical protein
MYTSAIDYHIYAVLLLVITITLFYLYTQLQRDFNRYKILIRNWMPIYVFALASAIFTGIVMMAAKHLIFDLPNLLMIFSSAFLIGLEIIRHKRMKASPQSDERAYIIFAKRIYAIELVTLFATVYFTKLAMMA